MDLSALIFVALAVAWAVYLVPKALKHHDDVVRSRSVDRFSHTMRVLARREPVNRRNARLVVQPGRSASAPVVTTKTPKPAAATAAATSRREAANRAARRRRRVLGALLFLGVVVVALAGFAVISWWYAAAPATLLVAWLVACRLMVRNERAVSASPSRRRSVQTQDAQHAPEDRIPGGTAPVSDDEDASFVDTSSMPAVAIDPTLWDPVPVTLPTYVTKPAAARRTVRTINLDDSGVWTSGRTDVDAAIARDADEADKAARARKQDGDDQRAVGS